MLFLDLGALVLLLLCTILGYDAAMDRLPPRPRPVMVWSAVGGAVGGAMVVSLLLIFDRYSSYAVVEQLRHAPAVIGECALFGLTLGVAGLLTNARSFRRLFATGVTILGLVAAIRGPFNVGSLQHLYDRGGWGLVLGPNEVPLPGVPVFLSRGDGSLESLTTDATGQFRVRLQRSEYRQANLLICVPGGAPYVAYSVENSPTPARYQITARPHAMAPSDLRALGWRHIIPRECLPDRMDLW